MSGKVVTLGEVLTNPSFHSLHPDLKLLQRFLRSQKLFRDDRRQVVLVGGLHGFHVCTWIPLSSRPYSRDGVPMFDFVPSLTGLSWEPCGQIDLGSHTKVCRFWVPDPVNPSPPQTSSAIGSGSSVVAPEITSATVNILDDPWLQQSQPRKYYLRAD